MSIPSPSYHPTPQEIELLRRDKYDGDLNVDLSEDLQRLASGEPLAYVIGWIPFVGLKVFLESPASLGMHALIPRPETEWWTEKLISHLKYRFANAPFTLLDLCAGSGAIGLSVLSAFPNSHVVLSEIDPAVKSLIEKNIQENKLDQTQATILEADLFNFPALFSEWHFDIIATNPPYIPESSKESLSASVTSYEPHQALFAGEDGLEIIKRIVTEAPSRLNTGGEVWMECDISNIAEAQNLLVQSAAAETTIHEDQYGRPRLIVAHFE